MEQDLLDKTMARITKGEALSVTRSIISTFGYIISLNISQNAMTHFIPKHLEEQIPKHLSPSVKDAMRRHLREEYLKTFEKKQEEEVNQNSPYYFKQEISVLRYSSEYYKYRENKQDICLKIRVLIYVLALN